MKVKIHQSTVWIDSQLNFTALAVPKLQKTSWLHGRTSLEVIRTRLEVIRTSLEVIKQDGK